MQKRNPSLPRKGGPKASVTKRRRKPRKVSVSTWLNLKTQAHDRTASQDNLPAHARIAAYEVDDPLSTGRETERIVVARSISADPLAWMHSHHRIDDAKYHAGRRWQGLFEQSVLGAVQAVDTTKEPVDGGRWPDLLTDSQALANRELARLRAALGASRSDLIRDVLGHGMFLAQAATARGVLTDTGRRELGRELHASLDILAVELGYATREGR